MSDETNVAEITENTEATESTAETPAVISEPEFVPEVGAEEIKKSARNLRKERIGMVVSNKMQKTAVVKIEESVKHSKYSKILKRSVKFKVHDEKNECDIGDRVLIMETRPLSRDKRWRLVKILEKVK